MNEFDRRIEAAWNADSEKEFGASDRIFHSVFSGLYEEMDAHEADLLVYRSANFGRLGIGSAFEVQRRIILRMIDREASTVINDRSASDANTVVR